MIIFEFSPLVGPMCLNDTNSCLFDCLPSPSESLPNVSYSEIGRCSVKIFFTSESVLPKLSDSVKKLLFRKRTQLFLSWYWRQAPFLKYVVRKFDNASSIAISFIRETQMFCMKRLYSVVSWYNRTLKYTVYWPLLFQVSHNYW